MIIPIAIDLSEYNAIVEYAHDSVDFATLSKTLYSYPFLLLHDSDSIEHSHFYKVVCQLPQKSRDAFLRICKKIPLRAVPDWNGDIAPNNVTTLYSMVKIVAVSKSKFVVVFNYYDDTYVAPHPAHTDVECAIWKAIEHTQSFSQMQQFMNTSITKKSLRSTLWQKRFATLIAANKWKRIKLVDRFLFLAPQKGKSRLDFTAIDYMIERINHELTDPTEIEIFLQTDKYRKTGKAAFDDFPVIINHLQKSIEKLSKISRIRMYSYNNQIGGNLLHDRFMYMYSTRELLYTYKIGVGFKVMHNEHIGYSTDFSLSMHTIPSENELYSQITKLTPSQNTTPDYSCGKVSVYICDHLII